MPAGHGPGYLHSAGCQKSLRPLVHYANGRQPSITKDRQRLRQCRVSRKGVEAACSKHEYERVDYFSSDGNEEVSSFKEGVRLPTQGESLVKGVDSPALQLQERERDDGSPDFAFLSVRITELKSHWEYVHLYVKFAAIEGAHINFRRGLQKLQAQL